MTAGLSLVSGRGLPLRDDGGSIIRWYGLLTDIDGRKGAEEELRRSEAFLRADAQRVSSHRQLRLADRGRETSLGRTRPIEIYGFDPTEPVTLDLIRNRLHP